MSPFPCWLWARGHSELLEITGSPPSPRTAMCTGFCLSFWFLLLLLQLEKTLRSNGLA